jgi:fucose permease
MCTLEIRGLGPLTEEGSCLLIMAIAGGALSALQGVIADHIGLQLSYLLPAACYEAREDYAGGPLLQIRPAEISRLM